MNRGGGYVRLRSRHRGEKSKDNKSTRGRFLTRSRYRIFSALVTTFRSMSIFQKRQLRLSHEASALEFYMRRYDPDVMFGDVLQLIRPNMIILSPPLLKINKVMELPLLPTQWQGVGSLVSADGKKTYWYIFFRCWLPERRCQCSLRRGCRCSTERNANRTPACNPSRTLCLPVRAEQ